MQIRTLLAAAAVTAAVAFPAVANATIVNLADTTTQLGDLTGASAYNFTASYNNTAKKSGVVDAYTAIASNGLTGTATTFAAGNTGLTFHNDYFLTLTNASSPNVINVSGIFANGKNPFSNMSVILEEKINGVYTQVASGTSGANTSNGYGFNLNTTYANLNAGSYEIVVAGALAGGKVGNYSGSISVNPVPLPAALPLFGSALFGAGLLGRRRRQQTAA